MLIYSSSLLSNPQPQSSKFSVLFLPCAKDLLQRSLNRLIHNLKKSIGADISVFEIMGNESTSTLAAKLAGRVKSWGKNDAEPGEEAAVEKSD